VAGAGSSAFADPAGRPPADVLSQLAVSAAPSSVRTIQVTGYRSAGDGGQALWRRAAAEPSHPGKLRSVDRFLPDGSSNGSNGGWWEIASSPLVFEMLGAKGDGFADDAPAINACSEASKALGHTLIEAGPGKVYRVESPLRPRRDLTWNLNGSAILGAAASAVFGDQSDAKKTLIGAVTADVRGPTDTLAVSSTQGVSPGDWVAVRLGDNAWDPKEPRYAVAARVLEVGSYALRLDWLIPHSIELLRAKPWNRAVYKLSEDQPVNVTWRNGELRCEHAAPGVEGGFFLRWGVNLRFEDINGNLAGQGDMGCGLFGLIQFCRHIRIERPILNSNRNARAQGSFGRMFNFSNCIDVVVTDAVARNCEGMASFLESYCEDVTFLRPRVEIRRTETRQSQVGSKRYAVAPFFIGQGSSARLESPTIVTDGPVTSLYDSGGSAYALNVRGLFGWYGPMPLAFYSDAAVMHCRLDYRNGPEFAKIDYVRRSTVSARIELAPNRTGERHWPGPQLETSLFASAGANLSGLSDVRLGSLGAASAEIRSLFRAGKLVRIGSGGAGLNYGGFVAMVAPRQVTVATNAEKQPDGAYLSVRERTAVVLECSAFGGSPAGRVSTAGAATRPS
jgi:hypothetical protein